MTPEGAADLLRVIDRQNPYMAPGTPQDVYELAQVWASTLHRDMTVEWAIRAVVEWYRHRAGSIAPSDLNTMWKAELRHQASQRVVQEALAARARATPPTPDYLSARNALVARKETQEGESC